MSRTSSNSVVTPLSSRPNESDSDTAGGDSDEDRSSDRLEPLAKRSQILDGGGDRKGGGRESLGSFRVFEVEFPPTGPLGITFEWAADPPSRFYGDGGTAITNPRPLGLVSSTLPPISSPLPSIPKDRATLPLGSLSDMEAVPHALRIQCFPCLPPPEETTPRAIIETGKTAIAVNDDIVFPDHGAVSPPVASKPQVFEDGTRLEGEEQTKSGSRAGAAPSQQQPFVIGTKLTKQVGLDRRFGPVAGRHVLRPGDILVAVNGTPVAGPAARDAGITSFEDAVGVVATSAQVQTAEDEQPKPRVFKFRREEKREQTSFFSSNTSSPLPNAPLEDGWVRGMPGSASPTRSSTPSQGTPGQDRGSSNTAYDTSAASSSPETGWSKLYEVLKHKGRVRVLGLAAGECIAREQVRDGRKQQRGSALPSSSSALLSARARGSDSSAASTNGMTAQFSSRSGGSASSDASCRSKPNGKESGVSSSRRREKARKGRDGASVLTSTSAAARIKEDARRAEALLEPLICPRQQRLKHILETSATLRPLAVRLTNLSYWYQQRRLLGGFRHMHRRAVFDPRSKRWEASVYMLGDRPSDGKFMPILTPVKSVGMAMSTEGQALALAAKSARERDANPGAARGPKPPGLTELSMLQTHISILVVSEAFAGLSHVDRLALVFMVLHDKLAATRPPPPPPPSPSLHAVTTTTTTRSSSTLPESSPPATAREMAKAGKERDESGAMGGSESTAEEGMGDIIGSKGGGHVSPRQNEGDNELDCEGAAGDARPAEHDRGEEEEARGVGEVVHEGEGEGQAEKVPEVGGETGAEPELGGGGGQRGRDDETGAIGAASDESIGGSRPNPKESRQEGELPSRDANPAAAAQATTDAATHALGNGGGEKESHSTSAATAAAQATTQAAADANGNGEGEDERRTKASGRRRPRPWQQHQHQHQHQRYIRGGVKASFVGPNVEALPVWGALDAMAGTELLVDCRTPAQWRAEEHRPTAQELWGPARSGHRTLANKPRVSEASVRSGMERIIAESKALREAAPQLERFDRFVEEAGLGGGGGGGASPVGPKSLSPSGKAKRHPRAARKYGGGGGGEPPRLPSNAHGTVNADPAKTDRKPGRTHPHFFHGLGPNARKLFMELYTENRSRLLAPISRNVIAASVMTARDRHHHRRQQHAAEHTSSAAPSDGSSLPTLPSARSGSRISPGQVPLPPGDDEQASARSPVTAVGSSPNGLGALGGNARGGGGGGSGAAANVRHAAGAFAAAGAPPDRDVAIMDRYGVLLGRLVEAATRVQRARRRGGLPRAARRYWRRQRAALALQRVFRGHLGRRYASMLEVVSALAATKISTGWRRFTARREFLVFRARARAGAIGLQALYRGHVARRYTAWCAEHFQAARHIQRVARGFVVRSHARRLRASRSFELCGAGAVLRVQKTIRGFLVRRAYARRFEEAVRVRVAVPAAGVLQKCWRGKKGRQAAVHRRRMWAAATEIQRHARGMIKRLWWARVLLRRLQHVMATRIAAVGRGYIDREIVKARRERRYFLHTVTPACILIQSQWRGYTKRRDLARHKQRWLAALFIQIAYRGVVFRRKARRQYHAWLVRQKGFSATKIQCLFRKWRSRQQYRVRRVEASWRRTFASRIILRSWRSYKMNLAMDELKEQWRVERAALELVEAQRDKEEIKGDLDLCLDDITAVKRSIGKAKRRIKDLVEFRKEAELRLPLVERLIEDLTVQDMAAGWGENYDREWDMLTNCMSLAVEEERIMRVKIVKLEKEMEILKLEIDDQEADMDAACSKEFDRMEALHRMEISRGLGLAARDRAKAVRQERMRWAVKDVRRHVIKRSRKDLQRFGELARAKRPLDVMQTISYEKRRDQERDEEAEVRSMEREAQKERFLELKKKGEGSLAIREVYDAVISGVRDIIATATFDARRAKQDYRGLGPDEIGPAASAAASSAAASARKFAAAAAACGAGGSSGDAEKDTEAVENSAAAAAAEAAAAAAGAVGGAEPGGGKVCRECGGPRFGRTVCAKCGANAKSWRGGAELEGEED